MGDFDGIDDVLNEMSGNDLESISNIDDFLDQLEIEARMSTKQQRQTSTNLGAGVGYGARPQQAQPQQAYPRRQTAPSNAQPQQAAYSNRPPAVSNTYQSQPQQTYPSRQPAPSNAQPVRQVAQQTSQSQQQRQAAPSPSRAQIPTQQPVAPSGVAELESQGYERHNNPGKWIGYTGGKATDFRIEGTTSTRVGLAHVITLKALDDAGQPAHVDNPRDFIGCVLTHQQTGASLQCWFRDNNNCRYDLGFCSENSGSVRMEIKLAGNPMFDIEIQVEDLGTSSWVAKPRLPAKPKELFIIDIETTDGSRPEGVAPFEVQSIGSVENLRLINNGDGTYRFQCVPQSHGHITIQLTLHGQPIKNSPVTVSVGDRQPMRVKQESARETTITDTRTPQQLAGDDLYYDEPPQYGGGGGDAYRQSQSFAEPDWRDSTNVSNEDLTRLLDELGGDNF